MTPELIAIDKEIYDAAILHLHEHRSISIEGFFKHKKYEDKFKNKGYPDIIAGGAYNVGEIQGAKNRLESKLLETGEFIKTDDSRIRFNPDYKKEKWSDKHPVWAIFRTAGVGALFSLIVGVILWLIADQKQSQVDNQQDAHLNNLTDSVATLQKHKMDSAKFIITTKSDTAPSSKPRDSTHK